MNEKEFKRLRRQVAQLKEKADRAEGKLDQVLDEIRRDFDVDDIDAAEDLLDEMKEELADAQAKLDKAKRDFDEEWGGRLEKGS